MRKKALIPILIIILGITIITAGYFDTLVKKTLIYFGQKATGARVEILKSSTLFKPFGLKLENIHIADPNNEFQNLFSAKEATIEIHLSELLQGRILIEKSQISGLEKKTKRTTSGLIEIMEKEKRREERGSKKIKKLEKITERATVKAKENVQNEVKIKTDELQAKKVIDKTQKKLEEQHSLLKNSIEKLDTKQLEKNIQERITAIQKSDIKSLEDIQKIKNEIEKTAALRKEVNRYKKQINKIREQIKQSEQILSKSKKEIQKASQRDYRHLTRSIQADNLSINNISKTLFQNTLLEKGQTLFQKLNDYRELIPKVATSEKPVITPKETGSTITFKDTHPKPKFWIKNITLSGKTPETTISGSIMNITSHPKKTNLPLTISYHSKGKDSLILNYELDNITDSQNISFSHTKPFSTDVYNGLNITQAKSQKKGKLTLINNKLNGNIAIQINQIQYQDTTSKTNTKLDTIIKKVIQRNKTIDCMITLSGTPKSPNLSISSDIDKKIQFSLKEETNAILRQKKQAIKKELNKAITKEEKVLTAQFTKTYAQTIKNQEKEIQKLENQIKDHLNKLTTKEKESLNNTLNKAKKELLKTLPNLF